MDNAWSGEADLKQKDNTVITDLCSPGTQPLDFTFIAMGKFVLSYASLSKKLPWHKNVTTTYMTMFYPSGHRSQKRSLTCPT